VAQKNTVKEFLKHIEPRILFGFLILVVLAGLAIMIAFGTVKQESSYGLEIVLGSLSTLAGAFAQWAFSTPKDKPNA
jgi:hypothetical protein